jgi:hypothetical protein
MKESKPHNIEKLWFFFSKIVSFLK